MWRVKTETIIAWRATRQQELCRGSGVLCSAALSSRIKAHVRGAQLGMHKYRNAFQDYSESKVKSQLARLVVEVIMMVNWWLAGQLSER